MSTIEESELHITSASMHLSEYGKTTNLSITHLGDNL